MAELTLYGGCTFCNVHLKQMNNDASPLSTVLNKLKQTPLFDRQWDTDTVLAANFNNILSASNFEGDFQNIKYFKIFKKFSQQPELHDVFTTSSSHIGVVEDFIVGSRCPYTYYIYPILESKNDKGQAYEQTGTVIKSHPFEFNDGVVRIIGLIQDEDDPELYHIDRNNLWQFSLNLSDEGFSNTIAKTFSDTLHRYQKETKGNGSYRTFNIEGLLGKYDCETDEYIDTYDDIVEWEKFMENGELKVAIDIRGIVTLGDIDSNSFQYNESANNSVNVSFSFRQLDDLNNVKILGRQLPVNPLNYDVLADNKPRPLQENTPKADTLSYLAAPRE